MPVAFRDLAMLGAITNTFPNVVRDPFKIPTFHRPSSTTVASLSSFTAEGTDFFERHVWMNHSPGPGSHRALNWCQEEYEMPARYKHNKGIVPCIIWLVQFIKFEKSFASLTTTCSVFEEGNRSFNENEGSSSRPAFAIFAEARVPSLKKNASKVRMVKSLLPLQALRTGNSSGCSW